VTELEVMAKLGLKPWSKMGVPGERRSGRTWRMLVEAVVAASEGCQVYIEGHASRYTRELQDRARMWCEACGIDPRFIMSRVRMDELYATYFFRDHHVGEAQHEAWMRKMLDEVERRPPNPLFADDPDPHWPWEPRVWRCPRCNTAIGTTAERESEALAEHARICAGELERVS